MKLRRPTRRDRQAGAKARELNRAVDGPPPKLKPEKRTALTIYHADGTTTAVDVGPSWPGPM